MNEKTKTGLEILQVAVLLGILGDVLLRATPWGLNIFLFIGALAAAMTMLILRRRQEFWNAQTILLNGALVFFAAMFVWRDSMELKIFDTLAILTILAVLTLPALKIKTQIAGVFHYFIGFVWSGISAGFAPFFLIFNDVGWKTIPQKGWSKHLISVLRGLTIAIPILLVFGALFVAADAVFQGIIEKTFNIQPEIVVGHIFFISFFAWIVAGYLRGSLIENFSGDITETFLETKDKTKPQTLSVTEIKEEDAPKTEEKPKPEDEKKWQWQNFDNSVLPNYFTLGAIETAIILGLINLLFLSFVIVQIPYLFGGMDLVQNTPDFKLADYARRGFGELVTVSALVLPILLVSHWLLRKDKPINEKIYRVLAGIQIILLFVIMISATQRLLLLTGNLGYGLTTIRFYPMAVMVLLALVFVWFALTVLRGMRQQFAWGALWLSLFMLGTLHVLSPDDFIVRTNVRLMQEGRSFDSNYVSQLSDDTVPALLEAMPTMNFEKQCVVKNKLLHRLETAQTENDFRSWNWARWTARIKMTQSIENLDTTNCPAYTQEYFDDF
ncbi:MAG: DUF4173 domain-containing protein [Acidobacteria bacterium]|jgi:hypothetical protein|nr:DUF4173 domain-containing protein [Acidobacteriota bacterium]